MADENVKPDEIDGSNSSMLHASEDAKKAAQERMQAAIEAKKRGEEIQTDTSSLEDEGVGAKVTEGELSEAEQERIQNEKLIENVKVYSPFHVYYDGDAHSVSAENLTGPFDVLYGHKNFMSLLIPCEVIIRSSRGEERIKIDRGVMHVRDNKMKVFLDV